MQFCVRTVVNAGLTGVVFRDLVLDAEIDLSADIPSFQVQVDSFLNEAVQDVDTDGVTIEAVAVKCKQGPGGESDKYIVDSSAITPNSILGVCVVGKSAAIECKDIEELVLKQGSRADDKRVDDYQPSFLSDVTAVQFFGDHDGSERESTACLFQTRMDGSYFVDVSPENVQVTGKALMDFASSRRRQLRDSRQLQQTGGKTSKTSDFAVELRLDNEQPGSFNQIVDSASVAGQCLAVAATATAAVFMFE